MGKSGRTNVIHSPWLHEELRNKASKGVAADKSWHKVLNQHAFLVLRCNVKPAMTFKIGVGGGFERVCLAIIQL